ncbi:uncharacterized protein LOC116350299 [Contarinia nasturtii]|uniref:uncharacterized protein LOC116350299 n=1 Tax=Contarinia nasturtii TaxID=265458 RepID=UPI0012D47FCF|nr:uncharacterized protein LOC116350299 [Contarinia nasturtii]
MDQTSIVYKNVLPWRGCEKLYLDSRTADIFFEFALESNECVKVPAHKCILSASPVFDAMFYGPAQEMTNTVTIVDASPDEFKEFLQFFYLSSVRLMVENKPAIMNLGEKYMLNVCKKACTELSKATLTMENMCLGYELAILFNQDDLKEYCEAKISENPTEFFKSQSFLDCEPNLLRYILQLNSLNCDESVVFDGCMAWAKTACIQKGLNENDMQNLRSELGDLFYEIRFGGMSTKKFNDYADTFEGLFSMKEFRDIVAMTANVNYRPPKFNRKPRSSVCDRVDRLESHSAESYMYDGASGVDYTVFSSNRSTLLTKICFSDFIFNDDKVHQISVRVSVCALIKGTRLDNKIVPAHILTRQIDVNPSEETLVEFTKPIVIKADMQYRITFEIEKAYQHVLCKNLLAHKEKVDIGDGNIIEFHDPGIFFTNKKFGLLTQLHFRN